MMEIMPPGTIDPSPFIYDIAMYTLGGAIYLSFLANYTMKPIDEKHYEKVVQIAE